MSRERALLIFVGAGMFYVSGWQFHCAIQHPDSPTLWATLGVAMFTASMGHALVRMSTDLTTKP